uniref:Major facilitator superfamily domain containing 2B n=1 Tax=Cyprinus carpio TaxID=7962 RepID=A0A8C1YST5_CYPCA
FLAGHSPLSLPLIPKTQYHAQFNVQGNLSVCSKLCFAIGGAPNQVAGSATAFFLQIYLLDIAQINPFQASMVLFVGKAWGAITDPIVGFFITKSKWTKIGRLMPWMMGCTPFMVVSYFYLWFVPPFTKLYYISICRCFLLQLIQSNFVLFCTYAVELRDHFQNIVLTILMSAAVSIPFWQWFLEKFGKKTAAFCGITWIMPFTVMLVFIPNLIVAYVVAVSSGISVAASLLLPWSMLPDVVDDFRLANRSSKGHEAIFYSLYAFFTKFAAGISLGVSTLCLQFAGYDTGACRQPPPVVYTLKLLIGAAPVVCITTGLMILLVYPISEDVRLRNKLALEELR